MEARERRTNPAPPFTTPKLQQAAARSLGFSVRKTMTLAQRLYEGKPVGDQGTVGLITYMRTDSVRTADEALVAVREYVARTWTDAALPPEPRRYKQKKDVQDAHEAIRPTTLELPPQSVAPYLEPDELKLYRLIWNRFVASQMTQSISEVTTVDIEARREGSPDLAGVRATGSVLRDPGFLRVYGQVSETESQNAPEDEAEGDDSKVRLPVLAQGDALELREASADGHETQPPPRFNEASLVKFMEENGIGRPSTYADILRKIEQREYVRKKDRRFIPTPLGRLVVDLMKEGFEDFFQTEYTARMEEELDEVEEGKLDWRKALKEFDSKFSKDRERAKKQMHSVKAGLEMPVVRREFTDFKLAADPGDTCPESGHALKLRMGKAGLFVACSGYPDCTWTKDIPETEEDPIDPSELEGQTCEECGSPMRLRTAKNGSSFLGCTAYPNCRNAISVTVQGGKAEARPDEPTGEKCPVCGHDLVKRHGRFGEYVSCSNYPDCRYKPPRPSHSPASSAPSAARARSSNGAGASGRSTAAPATPSAPATSACGRCRSRARNARRRTCSCASASPAPSTCARRRAAASTSPPWMSSATRCATRSRRRRGLPLSRRRRQNRRPSASRARSPPCARPSPSRPPLPQQPSPERRRPPPRLPGRPRRHGRSRPRDRGRASSRPRRTRGGAGQTARWSRSPRPGRRRMYKGTSTSFGGPIKISTGYPPGRSAPGPARLRDRRPPAPCPDVSPDPPAGRMRASRAGPRERRTPAR